LRLIVVDADRARGARVRPLLEKHPGRALIDEARTIADAQALLARQVFDVALVAERLPDGAGLDVLLPPSAERAGALPAVILLMPHADEETGLAAVAAGADDYLAQEAMNADALWRSIRYCIERRRLRTQLDERSARLDTLTSELTALATTDELTQIPNKRALKTRLATLFIEARRGRRFVYVLGDVDRFKSINDSFGHQAGDAVLVAIARTMKENVRAVDTVARYGGEEIAILQVDVDERAGAQQAERVRAAIEALTLPHGRVTMSFGVCAFRPEFKSAGPLVEGADRALYAAKNAGRNRVVAFGDLPPESPVASAKPT
jgi:two-component system cell cycle response regulator